MNGTYGIMEICSIYKNSYYLNSYYFSNKYNKILFIFEKKLIKINRKIE